MLDYGGTDLSVFLIPYVSGGGNINIITFDHVSLVISVAVIIIIKSTLRVLHIQNVIVL